MSPLNAAIFTTISYTLWVEWYYLKNNYLTLSSKVKVPRRSLRYATHCLMVMHPHTWMILFKKQLFDLEVKGQGPTKVIMVCDTPPYGHAPTYQISLTYLERQKCYDPDKKILFNYFFWPWGQRSRSHEGHYGARHTTLWSCTHIPNIIDLSRKTKMLWSGQENTI